MWLSVSLCVGLGKRLMSRKEKYKNTNKTIKNTTLSDMYLIIDKTNQVNRFYNTIYYIIHSILFRDLTILSTINII